MDFSKTPAEPRGDLSLVLGKSINDPGNDCNGIVHQLLVSPARPSIQNAMLDLPNGAASCRKLWKTACVLIALLSIAPAQQPPEVNPAHLVKGDIQQRLRWAKEWLHLTTRSKSLGALI